MPDLTVLEDVQAVAGHAAAWLLEKLSSDTARERAVCLSGGTTPRVLYDALAQAPFREAMPWESIHWFWCDERFVPATDARSNYNMVQSCSLGGYGNGSIGFRHRPAPPVRRPPRTRREDLRACGGKDAKIGYDLTGDYFGLPWPCYGTAAIKHPGSAIRHHAPLGGSAR